MQCLEQGVTSEIIPGSQEIQRRSRECWESWNSQKYQESHYWWCQSPMASRLCLVAATHVCQLSAAITSKRLLFLPYLLPNPSGGQRWHRDRYSAKLATQWKRNRCGCECWVLGGDPQFLHGFRYDSKKAYLTDSGIRYIISLGKLHIFTICRGLLLK